MVGLAEVLGDSTGWCSGGFLERQKGLFGLGVPGRGTVASGVCRLAVGPSGGGSLLQGEVGTWRFESVGSPQI